MRVIDRAFPGIGPVERHAPALGRIERGKVVDNPARRRAEQEGRTLARQKIGRQFGLEIFARQPHAVRARIPHQLAEQRIRMAVLRVGQGAPAAESVDLALVRKLAEVAAGVGKHGGHIAEQARHGSGFREFVVGAGIAGAQEAAEGAARFDEVYRIAGGEANSARQTVAAVERGGGAAQDLDRFDEAYIGIAAAARILRAERKALRRPDAVDLDQHAVAANTANDEILVASAAGGAECGTEAGGRPADRNAGFVANQILDVGHELIGDLFVVDDRHARRGVRNLQRRTRRRHHDLVVRRWRGLFSGVSGSGERHSESRQCTTAAEGALVGA